MDISPQKRAVETYRARLTERGMARFEVQGRAADRDLVRALARKLAEDGPAAQALRAAMQLAVSGETGRKGGILAALRRSPLVGANLDFKRARDVGRKIDL